MTRPLCGGIAFAQAVRRVLLHSLALPLLLIWLSSAVLAHAVAEGDKGYIQEISGVNILPFIYLGAKHMVTGYDHILFLFGVIFFLYRLKDIGLYVTLFAIGHSTTMLLGVYFNIGINSYIIDAIIGLSVVYKALDNMGAYQRWFGCPAQHQGGNADLRLLPRLRPVVEDPRLRHLARRPAAQPPRLQRRASRSASCWRSSVILIVMGYWRRTDSFWRHAYTRQRGDDDRWASCSSAISSPAISSPEQSKKRRDLTCTTPTSTRAELPSTASLLRSTVLAIVGAAAILVTVVLPAEYGIDPTGVGRMLGLTDMGETKQQLAAEAEADRVATAEMEAAAAPNARIHLTLPRSKSSTG